MDLGHSAQNLYLQTTAMGLITCAIGAFDDAAMQRVLQLPAEEELLYLMPVGYRG
jgi:nitroreductase